jgi:restriction endonuclease S subunit
VSVLKLSEVNLLNDRFRFDSEFLKKEYLQIENLLTKSNFKRLSEIDYHIKHPSEIKREYVEEGTWFFRTQNIRPLKIEFSNEVYISKEDAIKLKNNSINYNDIVITRTGANFGQTAIFNIERTAIGSSHTFILRNSYFNQSYLAVFFNTKYGRKLIDKGMYGGSQPEIAPYYISNIPIPDLKISFQNEIELLLKSSENKILLSKQTYTQAENLLLQEIGLQNFEPSKEAVNIKSFKESFGTTGRLDAEYYQKKYEEILMYIKSNCKYEKLESLTTFINNGNQPPYSENGEIIFFSQKWINDKSIDYSFLNSKDEPRVSKSFFDDKKNKPYLIQKHDILYYSVGANLGYCHNYLLDEPIAIGSFINLIRPNSNRVNPLYLGIVLNSLIGRLQSEKEKSGMAQPYIYAKSLREFIIPIIDIQKQNQIADLISESFQLKTESERLLEVAKKAVEMAIEIDEENAIKYIKDNEI